MIKQSEAEKIIHDCIHQVAITSESYAANKRLGQFSVIADDVVRAFSREVRENPDVGVRFYHHTLAAKELASIDSETLLGDIEEIIKTKSVKSMTAPTIP